MTAPKVKPGLGLWRALLITMLFAAGVIAHASTAAARSAGPAGTRGTAHLTLIHVYNSPRAVTTPVANTRGEASAANLRVRAVPWPATSSISRFGAAKGLTAAERVTGSVDDVARSAASPYSSASGGLSRAGQSLSKHQHRGGPFPQASGSAATISGQAQDIVEEVLTNPASNFTTRQTGRFGEVVDVQIPGGPGVRHSERDGFLHFLEP